MKIFTLICALFITVSSHQVFAHENHGDIPGTLKAAHGGLIKGGKIINLEMLAQGKTVLFFPSAHEGDTLDISKVNLSGTAKSPKGKPVNLTLTKTEKGSLTEVDFQGSHRLNLEIKAEVDGKTDIFKFLVEK